GPPNTQEAQTPPAGTGRRLNPTKCVLVLRKTLAWICKSPKSQLHLDKEAKSSSSVKIDARGWRTTWWEGSNLNINAHKLLCEASKRTSIPRNHEVNDLRQLDVLDFILYNSCLMHASFTCTFVNLPYGHSDPHTIVGGEPLRPGTYEVLVNVAIRSGATVPSKYDGLQIIVDVVTRSIPWPSSKVIINNVCFSSLILNCLVCDIY
ncbi:hypothetical protein ZWY2020_021658, partial [Hordeum vulgare]